MITKTFYMGEHYSELEVIVRANGIYITDTDDGDCICIPTERLQQLKADIDSMLNEQNELPRHLK